MASPMTSPTQPPWLPQSPPPQQPWIIPSAGPPMAPAAPPMRMGPVLAAIAAALVAGVVLGVVLAFLAISRPPTQTAGNVVRMTVAEFNDAMLNSLRDLEIGDNLIVSGSITSILSAPSSGSIVELDGTNLLFPVTVPSTCAVGDSLTMTLHVTVINFQGQTGKWFRELGDTPSSSISVPSSAISCT